MGHRKDRKGTEDAPRPVLAPDSPELRRRVAVLAGQVRDLGARAGTREAPTSTTRMLAAAERAASEIRESAQREAQRIRSGVVVPAQETAALLASARRQRHALAVIAAEVERLEQSAGILRAQLRALDAELAHMISALSAPAASRGTSRRPRE